MGRFIQILIDKIVAGVYIKVIIVVLVTPIL